ncbi:hypothetical protein ABES02_08590 [Neobacillus pocheonensis]|uniref:hypothetical protein n=1 Tax=Neobacillus pocheonensis TaxID=363869 RepID=UPI003D2BD562
MDKSNENRLKSLVRNSGNSDVDLTVNVDIDTKAIAYGMLCSLYAKGELTELELERAIQKLDRLIERGKRNQNSTTTSSENQSKSFDAPEQTRRRSWF